jgi:ubiquinone/menaquinone biosynthesis C-methylase UbiE
VLLMRKLCRNKQPILEALIQAFESHNIAKPTILEVASGTGQHAAHIATALPASTIQPTEHTAEMLPRWASFG